MPLQKGNLLQHLKKKKQFKSKAQMQQSKKNLRKENSKSHVQKRKNKAVVLRSHIEENLSQKEEMEDTIGQKNAMTDTSVLLNAEQKHSADTVTNVNIINILFSSNKQKSII